MVPNSALGKLCVAELSSGITSLYLLWRSYVICVMATPLCVVIYSMFVHLWDTFNHPLNFLYLVIVWILQSSMIGHHVVWCSVPAFQRNVFSQPSHPFLSTLMMGVMCASGMPVHFQWTAQCRSFAWKFLSYLWIVIPYATDAAGKFCLHLW